MQMNNSRKGNGKYFLDNIQLSHSEKETLAKINTLTIDEIIEQSKRNISRYNLEPVPIRYIDYTNYQYDSMIYSDLILLLNDTSIYNLPYEYFSTSTSHLTKQTDLIFSSKFESGNLRMALEVAENEYDLIIRPEINSFKTYHWFFFGVRLLKRRHSAVYKFNIINMTKQQILFNNDIRLLTYYDDHWSRNTFNVFYYQNGLASTSEAVFSTLAFSFDFDDIESKNKMVYFAYCFPYTYTHLSMKLQSFAHADNILRFEIIGKTSHEIELPMLVITDFNDNFDTLALKPAIILTARVHPGESNSSFTVEGVIEFLLSNHLVAVQLRKIFIFKIIPMLNPDGVMFGNFRMNTQGKDLNRLWIEPTPEISPSIVSVKNIITKTLNSRSIYLFCDFHGHSRKSNFFLYCCKTNGITNAQLKGLHLTTAEKKKLKALNEYHELVFPYIFQKESSLFDKTACTNKIHPSKVKTARAVLKNEYNIDLSYCLECSMASIRLQNGELIPFTMSLYKQIGRDFCISLISLINKKVFLSTLSLIRIEKNEQMVSKKDKKSKLLPPILLSSCQYNTLAIQKKKTVNYSNLQANNMFGNEIGFVNTNNMSNNNNSISTNCLNNNHSNIKFNKQRNAKKNINEGLKILLLNNKSNDDY